jgi:endonuclease/exonuclease/phosphatase family metal-dependent hydrolase
MSSPRPFIVFVIVSFLLLTNEAIAQDNPLRIKILSYNIHYGVGMDSKKDLQRIADVINKLNPDIVGLQEVADSVMIATLAKMTKMKGVFGASTEKETPNLYRLLGIAVPASQLYYGDGILSKHSFKYLGNVSLPSASSSRYEAMAIDVFILKQNGEKANIRFITTHFDYLESIGSDLAKKASIEVIEETFVKDSAKIPYILTGDFNSTPESDVLKQIELKGWVKEDFGQKLYTVPVPSVTKQIDYILVRPEKMWHITDVKVIEEGSASDHRPILMTLELL